MFSEIASQCLPEHKPWDHAIDLTLDTPSILKSKVYPMLMNEQSELDRFLKDKEYIVSFKSPIASPVFFIKKKDGKLQLIQDYRKLNSIIVKNCYPLLLASDIINQLCNTRIFTKFDVHWGYHNVRIKEDDEWKAAFITNRVFVQTKSHVFQSHQLPCHLLSTHECYLC